MDSERRKKAWNEARAEAYEVSLARHIVAPVETPKPVSRLTDAEVLRLEMQTREMLSERRLIGTVFESKRMNQLRHGVAEFVAEGRKELRKEFAEQLVEVKKDFEQQLGQLRADLTLARALTYEQPVDRSAEIVDMVQPLPRRQRRAGS